MALKADHPVLGTRALNRATLERQLLLRRATGVSAKDVVGHLVGLQAQNVKPPYFQLAARLAGFVPEDLSGLMESREVARLVTMRSTIHTHTADDCLTLRPLLQDAREKELRLFRTGLAGVDLDHLTAYSRDLVEERPRPVKELRDALAARWPDADPSALAVAARGLLPLVQTTPRGLWGRAGQVTLTTAEKWFGRPSEPAPAPDDTVLRYLGAFGPASVKDMQVWSGLTRLRAVFERLRPRLLTFRDEYGVELFDLPDAPRPDGDTPAPPRFLPEFDNLLLSHADRSRVVPPAYKGRASHGNIAHRALLIDGFLAGIWRVEESRAGTAGRGTSRRAAPSRTTLTVQLFARPTRQQRADVAEEGERLLTTMAPADAYDIRFADVSTDPTDQAPTDQAQSPTSR
ncbi:winged helix DNA-binding domain-containing protein [Streptomyces sp. SID3212]|uniref:DNA glycosylase AlkZ-like family protein n=1 Tax=Streptomyces sp. SID3212 TaxID=2690259 RepID=UPI00136FDAC4|nr:winged helix DNA-binding domain-containing protein [Streptomyces sp. SID3212]